MKSRWISVFWGLVMIAAGAAFLLDTQGIIDLNLIPVPVMALVFGALSALFFWTYFSQSMHNWGWLFPACILAGIAVEIGLDGTTLGNVLSGAPVLAGIAAPFVVVFLMDVKKHWWAIIPACVLTAIALVVLLEAYLGDNLAGALVLFGIALPFLFVYLLDHTRQWALIPFAAMSVIGLIPLMVGLFNDDAIGFMIMFLFAAAFFGVYFWSKTNWWALIPAGIFTSIGLTVLLDTLRFPLFGMGVSGFNNAGSAFLLIGFAATFGVLWLLRAQHPTDWAKYPALSLLALAVLALMFGGANQFIGPLVMIAAGVVILLLSLLKKRKS